MSDNEDNSKKKVKEVKRIFHLTSTIEHYPKIILLDEIHTSIHSNFFIENVIFSVLSKGNSNVSASSADDNKKNQENETQYIPIFLYLSADPVSSSTERLKFLFQNPKTWPQLMPIDNFSIPENGYHAMLLDLDSIPSEFEQNSSKSIFSNYLEAEIVSNLEILQKTIESQKKPNQILFHFVAIIDSLTSISARFGTMKTAVLLQELERFFNCGSTKQTPADPISRIPLKDSFISKYMQQNSSTKMYCSGNVLSVIEKDVILESDLLTFKQGANAIVDFEMPDSQDSSKTHKTFKLFEEDDSFFVKLFLQKPKSKAFYSEEFHKFVLNPQKVGIVSSRKKENQNMLLFCFEFPLDVSKKAASSIAESTTTAKLGQKTGQQQQAPSKKAILEKLEQITPFKLGLTEKEKNKREDVAKDLAYKQQARQLYEQEDVKKGGFIGGEEGEEDEEDIFDEEDPDEDLDI